MVESLLVPCAKIIIDLTWFTYLNNFLVSGKLHITTCVFPQNIEGSEAKISDSLGSTDGFGVNASAAMATGFQVSVQSLFGEAVALLPLNRRY